MHTALNMNSLYIVPTETFSLKYQELWSILFQILVTQEQPFESFQSHICFFLAELLPDVLGYT